MKDGTETETMDGLTNTWNDADEILQTPTPRTIHPSEVPTIPVARQERSETETVLLLAYRRESARLARMAASLKEMGIDPGQAWHTAVPDAPTETEEV